MGRENYECLAVRLDGRDHFVIWYQDDRDGFVRRPDERLLSASTPSDLSTLAAREAIVFEAGDPTRYDFDAVATWCRRPAARDMDVIAFLNAWNFLDDLAMLHERRDTPYARFSRSASRCYDKLFWGNNLEPVTPIGQKYIPRWLPGELEAIRRVMARGIGLLRVALTAD